MSLKEEHRCPRVQERVEWIYTYGDMVTLILCFFIILFANSKTKEEDFRAVANSLRGGPPASPYFFQGSPSIIDLVRKTMEQNAVNDEVTLTVDDRGISIVLNESLGFEPASATLTPQAVEIISKFSELIYTIPNAIVVEGHTDSLPVSNKFPSNWHLSSARASSVAVALMDEGIDRKRLEVVGFSDSRPLTSNETPQGRRLNRRVNILIKPNDAP